jgi:hypothetical protein
MRQFDEILLLLGEELIPLTEVGSGLLISQQPARVGQ